MSNFSISVKKARTPFYALVVIASAHDTGGNRKYMVDKVQEVSSSEIESIKTTLNVLSRISLGVDVAEMAPLVATWSDYVNGVRPSWIAISIQGHH